MKNIYTTISLFMLTAVMYAQTDSWKIKLNGKTILSTNAESPEQNVRKIKMAEWTKNGNLEILFTESDPSTWWRSFLLYDKDDNELYRKDSTLKLKMSLSDLKKLFAGKKEIIIYTTVAPKDPNLAVRIRRVHLCTLKLP